MFTLNRSMKKVGTFSRFTVFRYHKTPPGGIYIEKGGYYFAICHFLIPQIAAKWYLFERKCKIVPTVFILALRLCSSALMYFCADITLRQCRR